MKGPRLRNGLTPPQLVDEVLGKRIEVAARPAAAPERDELEVELRRTRVFARTAGVVAVWEGLLALIIIGLRLMGL